MTPHEYLIQLGVENVPHSGRSFYDHLCRVENILRICGCSEDVCLAGLYHSIYGTNFFTVQVTNDRDAVKAIIGEKAEELAWIFCNASRPSCWLVGNHLPMTDGSFLWVSNDTLHKLQMIEGANLLEQKCGTDMIISFTNKRMNNENTN